MSWTDTETCKVVGFSTIEMVQAPNTTCSQGHLAAVDTATGLTEPASAKAGLFVCGWFARETTTGAANGTCYVETPTERWARWLANDTVNPVQQSHVGSDCFVLDSTTVTADNAGTSVAGRVWKVDATKGVLVELP